MSEKFTSISEAYSQVYNKPLEEGIFGQTGARLKAAYGASKQYGKGLNSALSGGKGNEISASDVYKQGKRENIIKSIVKNALNDLVSLGVLGKDYKATDEDTATLTKSLGDFIATKVGIEPTETEAPEPITKPPTSEVPKETTPLTTDTEPSTEEKEEYAPSDEAAASTLEKMNGGIPNNATYSTNTKPVKQYMFKDRNWHQVMGTDKATRQPKLSTPLTNKTTPTGQFLTTQWLNKNKKA